MSKVRAAAAQQLKGASEAQLWRSISRSQRAAVLGGSAFPGDTPEKKAARLERYATDPLYFCRTLLPHYFTGPSASFHEAWIQHLIDSSIPDPEGGAPGAVVQCPRGGAKTTVLSFAGSLYLLLVKRIPFFILVTNVSAQSAEIVNAIADELEDNARIRTDFGELLASRADTKWGANVLLTSGCRLQALGMGSSFRGIKHGPHRPWLALIDDPESSVEVRNPDRRTAALSILTNDIRKAVKPGGSLFVVQNMIHADCMSGHIVHDVREAPLAAERGQPVDEFKFRRWQAFVYAIRLPDGSSAWPAVFSTAFLDALELEDPDGFALEMMNLPVARTGRIFRREAFRIYVPEDVAQLALWKVMACDPSLGKNDRSDFSAIVVLGHALDSRTFCLEADLKRRSPLQIVSDLFSHWLDYNPAVTLVEAVAFQSLLATLLEQMAQERGLYPTVKLYADTTPKDLRIRRLESPVNKGAIQFLASQVEMLKQLDLWPTAGVHDDGPDGLEMAWSEVQVRVRGVWKSGDVKFGGPAKVFSRRTMTAADLTSWRVGLAHWRAGLPWTNAQVGLLLDWLVSVGEVIGHVPAQSPPSLQFAA